MVKAQLQAHDLPPLRQDQIAVAPDLAEADLADAVGEIIVHDLADQRENADIALVHHKGAAADNPEEFIRRDRAVVYT